MSTSERMMKYQTLPRLKREIRRLEETNKRHMFTSLRQDWATPQSLFDTLDAEFHFDLDACATHENHKCDRYFTLEGDALLKTWEQRVFMNPPFKDIGKWVGKAYREALRGSIVVCLLPARTDTIWFHEYCLKAEIRFLKGRLRFDDGNGRATFPSMVVIFKASQ